MKKSILLLFLSLTMLIAGCSNSDTVNTEKSTEQFSEPVISVSPNSESVAISNPTTEPTPSSTPEPTPEPTASLNLDNWHIERPSDAEMETIMEIFINAWDGNEWEGDNYKENRLDEEIQEIQIFRCVREGEDEPPYFVIVKALMHVNGIKEEEGYFGNVSYKDASPNAPLMEVYLSQYIKPHMTNFSFIHADDTLDKCLDRLKYYCGENPEALFAEDDAWVLIDGVMNNRDAADLYHSIQDLMKEEDHEEVLESFRNNKYLTYDQTKYCLKQIAQFELYFEERYNLEMTASAFHNSIQFNKYSLQPYEKENEETGENDQVVYISIEFTVTDSSGKKRNERFSATYDLELNIPEKTYTATKTYSTNTNRLFHI